MNLLECSVKNQHLLKNFDTSEIEDGAKAYVDAGMTPQEAERKAVDDKLDELKVERSRVERDIITQYRAMRPAEVIRQPIQQSPKQTDTKPIFYSQMSRQIDKLMGKSEPVEELLLKLDGWAKSGKFKQDELNWSGLTDWLKTQDGKVTKQQVQDFIRENGVQVTETVLGGPESKQLKIIVDAGFNVEEGVLGDPELVAINDDIPLQQEDVPTAVWNAFESLRRDESGTPTKFHNYQLPGGENYRELLLTLPTTPIDEFANNKTFRSSHFDQPNILAHIRFNERTDAEGKRVLFIEEVQSDWAQKGRKEGFAGSHEEWHVYYQPQGNPNRMYKVFQSESGAKEFALEHPHSKVTHEIQDTGPPAAPFVHKTEAWTALALKRMIRYAAENGFERIAWTTGEQQEQRYWGNSLVAPAVQRWNEISKPQSVREELLHHFGSELAAVTPLKIVDAPMLLALKNDKVRRAVVEAIPVDVVNILSDNGISPDQFFRKPDVYGNTLPVDVRPAVARGFASALQLTGARLRTALDRILSKDTTRRDEEVLPAVRASELDSRVVMGLLSTISRTDLRPDIKAAPGVNSGTSNRTEVSPSLGSIDLAGVSPKLSTTQLAEALNRHASIISDSTGKPIEELVVQPPPGEGMKSFYDKIIPNVANDVLKKLGGGKVETTDLGEKLEDRAALARQLIDEVKVEDGDLHTIRPKFQPGFTITTALRESAMQGQPLFSPKTLANKNAAIPEETRLQEAQRIGQDKFNRFKIVHKWLGDNGLTLSEAANVYRAESLYYGRVASRVQDFRDIRVKDLIKDLEKTGHTLEEVDMALHAQHAEERNQQIAKINPQMRDGGSGMKTADAKAILAKLDPELLRVANDFRAITTDTKNILLASGLIDQDAANAWNATYKKYVPLKGGDEVVATGTGKHMDVNAKMKRAMGHSFRDEHIVENIIRDHERAITLAEKNRVGQVLLQFAMEADIPDLITIGQPEKRAVLTSPQPVYEVRYSGGTIATLHNLQDARAEMQYHIQTTGMPAKNFAIHKVQGGPSVRYQANPMLAENEARVYLNGQMVRMQINDPLMARAYKNLGQDHLVGVLKVGREINTWLSKAYTGYNPAFLLKNIVRDAGEGVINLTGDYGAGTAARVVANYPGQFLDLLVYAKSNKAPQLIRDYRADGGSTGASYLGDLERIGEDARAAYNDYAGVMDTARRDGVGSALHVAGDKTVRALAHYIEALNQAGENAMRLATYKTLREAGYSRSEAALAAKDVTLNFNRKGEIGQQAGALWLFFNPAVQGSSRTLHTLLHSEHKAQAWALTGAMAVLFYAMAAWNDDMDKKRWEETPSYDKAHNLIIPLARHQIKIPIPYGYGFFGALGTAAFDVKNGKPMKDVVWHLANAFVESFSPIGNPLGDKPEYKNAADIVPFTPLKVATQIGVNRSGLGGPIYPENQRAGKPDSATMFRSTKGSVWDLAASAANRATGGDEARAGWADVHPDTIKSLWATATGGTGRFITDSGQLGNVVARGASPELHEVPIVRDFVREPKIGDTRKAFWDAVNQVEVAQGEFATAKANMEQANKGASPTARADSAKIKDQVLVDTQAMRALGSALNQFKKAVDAKRDAIDAVQADKSLTLNEQRLKVKEMELEEKALYDRFLAIFKTQQARQKK